MKRELSDKVVLVFLHSPTYALLKITPRHQISTLFGNSDTQRCTPNEGVKFLGFQPKQTHLRSNGDRQTMCKKFYLLLKILSPLFSSSNTWLQGCKQASNFTPLFLVFWADGFSPGDTFLDLSTYFYDACKTAIGSGTDRPPKQGRVSASRPRCCVPFALLPSSISATSLKKTTLLSRNRGKKRNLEETHWKQKIWRIFFWTKLWATVVLNFHGDGSKQSRSSVSRPRGHPCSIWFCWDFMKTTTKSEWSMHSQIWQSSGLLVFWNFTSVQKLGEHGWNLSCV